MSSARLQNTFLILKNQLGLYMVAISKLKTKLRKQFHSQQNPKNKRHAKLIFWKLHTTVEKIKGHISKWKDTSYSWVRRQFNKDGNVPQTDIEI